MRHDVLNMQTKYSLVLTTRLHSAPEEYGAIINSTTKVNKTERDSSKLYETKQEKTNKQRRDVS